MSPEERAAISEERAERWARMSPEEREVIGTKRAVVMADLWNKRSEDERARIVRAMRFRWTTARRLCASRRRKAMLAGKSNLELRQYGQDMRAALTRRQCHEFAKKIRQLHHEVVLNGRKRGDSCSAAAFKILQGSFRTFEGELDETTKAQATALFKASSRQSKVASSVTRSARVRKKLEEDVTALYQSCRQQGAASRREERNIVRRLETAYGSLRDAPSDLVAMINEIRGGCGRALTSSRTVKTKLQSFLHAVVEYETRLATQGPHAGMLSVPEARRLAARFGTFHDDLSSAERDRYDRVYQAYLWRSGEQARRKGGNALTSRRKNRTPPSQAEATLPP
jgi:hypothetical protein